MNFCNPFKPCIQLLQRAGTYSALIIGNTNLWLASYLADRSSFVSMGTFKSNTVTHTTGVPQGEVSMFTTLSLVHSSPVSPSCITNMLMTPNCTHSVNISTGQRILVLSACADDVTRWHLENGLLLNPSKSETLITGSRHKLNHLTVRQV